MKKFFLVVVVCVSLLFSGITSAYACGGDDVCPATCECGMPDCNKGDKSA